MFLTFSSFLRFLLLRKPLTFLRLSKGFLDGVPCPPTNKENLRENIISHDFARFYTLLWTAMDGNTSCLYTFWEYTDE